MQWLRTALCQHPAKVLTRAQLTSDTALPLLGIDLQETIRDVLQDLTAMMFLSIAGYCETEPGNW